MPAYFEWTSFLLCLFDAVVGFIGQSGISCPVPMYGQSFMSAAAGVWAGNEIGINTAARMKQTVKRVFRTEIGFITKFSIID